MQLKIKKFGINGEGIGYQNRKAIFVEGALPDELVDVTIIQEEPTYSVAKINEVIEPSPRRRHPMCENFETCGGCRMMHVDAKGQNRMKEASVKEALSKYAGYTGKIEPILKNPEPLAYRNSSKMPFGMVDGKIASGMYKTGSNDFVPIERCLIHTKKQEMARRQIVDLMQKYGLQAWDPESQAGYRTLVLKEFNGEVHVILVSSDLEIPEGLINEILALDNVASLWQSVREPDEPAYELFGKNVKHLGGSMKMTLPFDDLNLCLLPKSFFQLNTAQAQNLYHAVMEDLPEHCHLLVEAYCGIGTMALMAADRADKVIGIESVEDAVENARENALINGKDNVEFVCGDAAEKLDAIAKEQHVDALIVDPPRSGLKPDMIQAILSARPQNLVYVSCNPSTLGKDLGRLRSAYTIKKVQSVDMFSQTPLCETVVRLELTPTERKPKTKPQFKKAGKTKGMKFRRKM